MKVPERRKYPRREQSFRVQVFKHGLDYAYEGTSLNVSQVGAFIKVENWRSFQVNDQAIIAFSLPPEYTGQNKIIQLQGEGVIVQKKVFAQCKGQAIFLRILLVDGV